MNTSKNLMFAILTSMLLFLSTGCEALIKKKEVKYKKAGIVRVWEMSDPTSLNPHISYDATAIFIKHLIFQRLLDFDYETYELIPVLAKE